MTQTRKECRAGAECRPREFNEAADCLGHHSERSLPGIARLVNRTYSYLSKALSLHAESHPLRGDLIVPLTLASADEPRQRNYALLDWMEAQVGRVAVLLPAGSGAQSESFELARSVIREAGEAIERFGAALEDGRVTDAELANVEHEVDEAIAALTRLKLAAIAQHSRSQRPSPDLRLAGGGGR